MSTLKKFLNRALLRELIPEQHIAVIERDGQINRLEPSGYIEFNRFSERIVTVIKTGPQQPVEIDMKNIRSADGTQVSVRYLQGWGFDPRRCNFRELPHLIRNAPFIQISVLKSFGTRVARNIIGSFAAEELRLGHIPAEIEHRIKTSLYREVRFAGITLFPPTVEQITLPTLLDKSLREAHEKRVQLANEAFEKQQQAEMAAATKRIQAEAETNLRSIWAETEAAAKRALADAEAHEQNVLTKIIVKKTDQLTQISATEMEWRYKWLASLPQDLAEKIAETEAFKSMAANGSSLNLYAPMEGPLSTSLLPLIMHQTVTANGHHNGK